MSRGAEPARRVEIFTGAGRRRDWSDEDRASIIAESYAGFDSVSGVARRHGLAPSQLFTWRRLAREAEIDTAMFVPAVLAEPANGAPGTPELLTGGRSSRVVGLIEVELNGVVIRIGQGADTKTVVAVLHALQGAS